MKRYLILEDGGIYEGEGFGTGCESSGKAVFTTRMTGYQEAITDQNYAGQILIFTNPLIGSYRITLADYESLEPQVKDVVCHQVARHLDSWRMQTTLPKFLERLNIPGLQGIDTRELVKKFQIHGTLKEKITDSKENVVKIAQELKEKNITQDVTSRVSTRNSYPIPGSKRNIIAVDFGIKHNVLRELARRDCNCIVLPYTASADEILSLNPDGVLLSDGPGDPEEIAEAAKMVQEVEKHVPLFGICMGRRVFVLANGAKTYKVKFRHRGFDHPVREIAAGNIGFTSQNHGYTVDPASIDKKSLMITHVEVNDGIVEGLRHKKYPAFSAQFHPDATPSPHNEDSLFDNLMSVIDQRKEEECHA